MLGQSPHTLDTNILHEHFAVVRTLCILEDSGEWHKGDSCEPVVFVSVWFSAYRKLWLATSQLLDPTLAHVDVNVRSSLCSLLYKAFFPLNEMLACL